MIHFPGPDSIFRQQLPNGITLLTYENRAAEFVVIEGAVRAGALGETRAQAGLAAFTSSLLLRGTATHSFEEIYNNLEAVGASLGISGGRHISDFGAKGLAEDLDLLLELLASSLRQPTFPEAQVEQVRGEILTGLQMRANDTRRMAGLRFRETLYGPDHPYGFGAGGYPETIQSLTRDDLARFHASSFGPRGLIITVVSPLPAAVVAERVGRTLGDWQVADQRGLPSVPPAARPAGMTRVFVPLAGKTQSDVVLGLPGPARSAPDYLEISLVNTIIGVFGMSGRLGKSVREEQGLAYYAFSRLQGGLGPAPWYASTGVAPEKVEQALTAMRAEIRRIQDEPVPDDELADCKAFRIGTMPVSLETSDGLASVIMDMELYGLGLDYLQRFPDLIRAITPARVQAAAQKYLSADDVVVAVAGPPAEE